MTLEKIRSEVRKMDPALKPHNPSFKTAVLLLAALDVGTDDLAALSTFTGYSARYVAIRAKRLRDNRVWVDGKTAADWFSENGGIAFWMDVCVAEGFMARAPGVATSAQTTAD